MLTRRSGSSGHAAQNNQSIYRAYTSPSSSSSLSAFPLSMIFISQHIGNCPATTSVLPSRWSPCRSSRVRNNPALTLLMMKPEPHDWNLHCATRRQGGVTINLSGDRKQKTGSNAHLLIFPSMRPKRDRPHREDRAPSPSGRPSRCKGPS